MSVEHLVLDASALIDLLRDEGARIRARIDGRTLHAPAHLDAEVLSAFGRLHRAGVVTADVVTACLSAIAAAPITRHDVASLLDGAWARRDRLRLADALYVELADRLGVRLITTDERLGRASQIAEVVRPRRVIPRAHRRAQIHH